MKSGNCRGYHENMRFWHMRNHSVVCSACWSQLRIQLTQYGHNSEECPLVRNHLNICVSMCKIFQLSLYEKDNYNNPVFNYNNPVFKKAKASLLVLLMDQVIWNAYMTYEKKGDGKKKFKLGWTFSVRLSKMSN